MAFYLSCMRFGCATTVAALLATGCSSAEPSTAPTGSETAKVDSLALELQKLDSDLEIGSTGDDVRTVHKYFQRYGYFPSSNLASEYPGWQPVVSEDPTFDDVFDEHTQQAVLKLQYQAGIEQTGRVDAATRDALRLERKSVLDRIDALVANETIEKFSFSPDGVKISPQLGIKWRLTNGPFGVNRDIARARVASALSKWAAETNLSFVQVTDPNESVTIAMDFIFFDDDNAAYRWTTPALGPSVTFDLADVWTTGGNPPVGGFDLETVALQATGRALGLGSSSISGSAMFVPLASGPGSLRGGLTADDKAAISILYDDWAQMPGFARDIAASPSVTRELWQISNEQIAGTSDFKLRRWDGTNWVLFDNTHGGVRISVGTEGPWIVQANGHIARIINNVWTPVVGDAKDIAAGVGINSVWAIGRLDSRVYKWNDSNQSWTLANNGVGHRIAVTSLGIPWVVQDQASGGKVFERTSSSATSGNWTVREQDSCANDIGALDHVWITSCISVPGGFKMAAWNFQFGGGGAPAISEWAWVDGGATQVTVSLDGPIAANSLRNIYQRKKTQ